jgi:hypothetical protein
MSVLGGDKNRNNVAVLFDRAEKNILRSKLLTLSFEPCFAAM